MGPKPNGLHAWQSNYGDVQVSDAKRLRQLEEENAMKNLVADLALDKQR